MLGIKWVLRAPGLAGALGEGSCIHAPEQWPGYVLEPGRVKRRRVGLWLPSCPFGEVKREASEPREPLAFPHPPPCKGLLAKGSAVADLGLKYLQVPLGCGGRNVYLSPLGGQDSCQLPATALASDRELQFPFWVSSDRLL